MRIAFLIAAGAAALSLAACESKADKVAENKSDAIKAASDSQANMIEAQAAATNNEATEDALKNKADAVRDAGDAKADAVEQAAGKKD